MRSLTMIRSLGTYGDRLIMNSRMLRGLALGVVIVALGVGFVVRYVILPRAADPAELAREQAENRLEVRAAFLDPKPATPEQTAEFTPILLQLGKSIEQSNAQAIRDCFHIPQFTDECIRAGIIEKIGAPNSLKVRSELMEGFGSTIGPTLIKKKDYFAWQSCVLRRVRVSEDGKEAIVIATHYMNVAGDITSAPMRWWLTKKSGSWRIYDFEELQSGLRTTALVVSAMSPELVKNPHQFQARMAAINEAILACGREDYEAADVALAPARNVGLPQPIAAMRALIEAFIAIGLQDAIKGMTFLDEAERLNPDMPITLMARAIAHNLLEEYGEAIMASNKYIDLLGPDATVLLQRGGAMENLDRVEEAATSYRQALDFEPDHVQCLTALYRVLSKENKSEWIARFKKRSQTSMEFLRTFAAEALADNDMDALEAVAAQMRKEDPKNANTTYYMAKIALERKQLDAAIRIFKESFTSIDDEARKNSISQIVFLLANAGHGLKVYEATPAKEALGIFRELADNLTDAIDDDEEKIEAPKRRAEFERIVEAHRKAYPNDAWIPYYQGKIEFAQNNLAEAEAMFRQSLEGMSKDEKTDRNRVRDHLLSVMFTRKRGHEAYALFGQESGVFGQLAQQFDNTKDRAGLKKLVGLHKVKNANDPDAIFWTGTVDYRDAEYVRAIVSYRAYMAVVNEEMDTSGQRQEAQTRVVRCLVRLKKFAEARTEWKAIERNADVRLKPLIAAATGDVDATIDAIQEIMEDKKRNMYGLYYFYMDEDLGPLLRAEPMKRVREKYPEPMNANPVGPTT